MNAIADKLDKARALIEGGWCQGEYALDANGDATDVLCGDPVCFCALGAIARATHDRLQDATVMLALAKVIRPTATLILAGEIVYKWNDRKSRRKSEVIDAFKRAAELARAGEL